MDWSKSLQIQFKSERRGYTLTVERDLLGDLVLIRRWYGLGNRRGGFKREVFLQEGEARKAIGRICRSRLQHGYHLLGSVDFINLVLP